MFDVKLGDLVFATKDQVNYGGVVIETDHDRITILDEFADEKLTSQIRPMSMETFTVLSD